MNVPAAMLGFVIVGFIFWFILAILLRLFMVENDVLAWTVIAAGWVLAGLYSWRRYQNAQPVFPDRHRCPHCGYDLRATPDRCPECGRTPDELAGPR